MGEKKNKNLHHLTTNKPMVCMRVAFQDNDRSQEKPPWADSACADCPGFLHLGAVLPRLPPSSRSLRLFPGLAFCFMGPWTFAWMWCPQLPYHLCKNGTHSTCFYSTRGAHTEEVTKIDEDTSDSHKQGVEGLRFAEITETTEMTKTTGIRDANHEVPQTTGLETEDFTSKD